ncbi:hypothetical protein cyc_08869 [Cyclospora cayetanensis]|uniref:Uncharacterized protein n=1 Tax=Cyclospora cayetanensis TaxID=88456 RepID=A0A1D3D438_9EIME|nr:hypothetical protein cyc_08869 [Cyclospora cayetanensis]
MTAKPFGATISGAPMAASLPAEEDSRQKQQLLLPHLQHNQDAMQLECLSGAHGCDCAALDDAVDVLTRAAAAAEPSAAVEVADVSAAQNVLDDFAWRQTAWKRCLAAISAGAALQHAPPQQLPHLFGCNSGNSRTGSCSRTKKDRNNGYHPPASPNANAAADGSPDGAIGAAELLLGRCLFAARTLRLLAQKGLAALQAPQCLTDPSVAAAADVDTAEEAAATAAVEPPVRNNLEGSCNRQQRQAVTSMPASAAATEDAHAKSAGSPQHGKAEISELRPVDVLSLLEVHERSLVAFSFAVASDSFADIFRAALGFLRVHTCGATAADSSAFAAAPSGDDVLAKEWQQEEDQTLQNSSSAAARCAVLTVLHLLRLWALRQTAAKPFAAVAVAAARVAASSCLLLPETLTGKLQTVLHGLSVLYTERFAAVAAPPAVVEGLRQLLRPLLQLLAAIRRERAALQQKRHLQKHDASPLVTPKELEKALATVADVLEALLLQWAAMLIQSLTLCATLEQPQCLCSCLSNLSSKGDVQHALTSMRPLCDALLLQLAAAVGVEPLQEPLMQRLQALLHDSGQLLQYVAQPEAAAAAIQARASAQMLEADAILWLLLQLVAHHDARPHVIPPVLEQAASQLLLQPSCCQVHQQQREEQQRRPQQQICAECGVTPFAASSWGTSVLSSQLQELPQLTPAAAVMPPSCCLLSVMRTSFSSVAQLFRLQQVLKVRLIQRQHMTDTPSGCSHEMPDLATVTTAGEDLVASCKRYLSQDFFAALTNSPPTAPRDAATCIGGNPSVSAAVLKLLSKQHQLLVALFQCLSTCLRLPLPCLFLLRQQQSQMLLQQLLLLTLQYILPAAIRLAKHEDSSAAGVPADASAGKNSAWSHALLQAALQFVLSLSRVSRGELLPFREGNGLCLVAAELRPPEQQQFVKQQQKRQKLQSGVRGSGNAPAAAKAATVGTATAEELPNPHASERSAEECESLYHAFQRVLRYCAAAATRLLQKQCEYSLTLLLETYALQQLGFWMPAPCSGFAAVAAADDGSVLTAAALEAASGATQQTAAALQQQQHLSIITYGKSSKELQAPMHAGAAAAWRSAEKVCWQLLGTLLLPAAATGGELPSVLGLDTNILPPCGADTPVSSSSSTAGKNLRNGCKSEAASMAPIAAVPSLEVSDSWKIIATLHMFLARRWELLSQVTKRGPLLLALLRTRVAASDLLRLAAALQQHDWIEQQAVYYCDDTAAAAALSHKQRLLLQLEMARQKGDSLQLLEFLAPPTPEVPNAATGWLYTPLPIDGGSSLLAGTV